MFRVAQKVVCVDASKRHLINGFWARDIPVEGRVYTVSGNTIVKGMPGVLLREIRNDVKFLGSYDATRFRPIVSRPTSIEFAHEILRSVNAPTKERAHV